jgi:predicted Rossmann-fold nucleotide-binding protein
MPSQPSSVAVYCGSNSGTDPAFTGAAASLGRLLAERGLRLVYGGGHVGLMGTVADAVLDGGGEAHGVITRALEQKEIAHAGLTSLRVTETMHERKAAMADAADAVVMLPGGYGTLDEFFDPLRAFLDGAVAAGFVHPAHRDMVIMDDEPARLLDRLAAWTPVEVSKWLDRAERLSPAAG